MIRAMSSLQSAVCGEIRERSTMPSLRGRQRGLADADEGRCARETGIADDGIHERSLSAAVFAIVAREWISGVKSCFSEN